MKSFVFIKNTVILTATSLILRVVGMLFKIRIAAAIGSEGIGLYQLIMSVYVLTATFASTGICTGVTKLVSENRGLGRRGANGILLPATVLTLVGSAVIGLTVYFSAPLICRTLISDLRAQTAVRLIALALPFKGIAACVKGYFYARKNTLSPSLSQLFEQGVRISVILLMITLADSTEKQMTALIVGDASGEAASLLFIGIAYIKEMRRTEKGDRISGGVYRELLGVALPVTGSRYITSGLHTAESLLVPAQLTYFTADRAVSLSQYGMLKGMALPALFFPAAFLSAMSVLLMPEISEAAAAGDRTRVRSVAERSVGITLVLSIPIATVFFSASRDIGLLLYGNAQVGTIIRMLSPIVPFMYLESAVDGMIKGLGQQKRSFWYNVLDSVLRIGLILVLVRKFGLFGFIAVMTASNILTSSLHTGRLLRVADASLDIRNRIIKPLIGSALGGAIYAVISSRLSLPPLASVILCGISVVLGFSASMLFLHGIDASLLPMKALRRTSGDRKVTYR